MKISNSPDKILGFFWGIFIVSLSNITIGMQKIIIELSKSSIDNGRIYFKSEDINFFPKSSLGDRASSGKKGSVVLFKAGRFEFKTDIRQNSELTLSPRSSFAEYIKEIKAIEGTKLLIERTFEDVYLVSKHYS